MFGKIIFGYHNKLFSNVSKVAIHEPKLNDIVSKPIWPNTSQQSSSHYTPPTVFSYKNQYGPPIVLCDCKKYLQAIIHSYPHECVDWKDTTMKKIRSDGDQ